MYHRVRPKRRHQSSRVLSARSVGTAASFALVLLLAGQGMAAAVGGPLGDTQSTAENAWGVLFLAGGAIIVGVGAIYLMLSRIGPTKKPARGSDEEQESDRPRG